MGDVGNNPMSPDGRALKKQWSLTIMRDMDMIQSELQKKTLRKEAMGDAISSRTVEEAKEESTGKREPTSIEAARRKRAEGNKENSSSKNVKSQAVKSQGAAKPSATNASKRPTREPPLSKPASSKPTPSKPTPSKAPASKSRPNPTPTVGGSAKRAVSANTRGRLSSVDGKRERPTAAVGRRGSAPVSGSAAKPLLVPTEPPKSLLPVPSTRLKVRGITVFRDASAPENALGEVIVNKNTTIEELKRLIREELGVDFEFGLKKGFIPVTEKQLQRLAVDFFRSEEDHAIISPVGA